MFPLFHVWDLETDNAREVAGLGGIEAFPEDLQRGYVTKLRFIKCGGGYHNA